MTDRLVGTLSKRKEIKAVGSAVVLIRHLAKGNDLWEANSQLNFLFGGHVRPRPPTRRQGIGSIEKGFPHSLATFPKEPFPCSLFSLLQSPSLFICGPLMFSNYI